MALDYFLCEMVKKKAGGIKILPIRYRRELYAKNMFQNKVPKKYQKFEILRITPRILKY